MRYALTADVHYNQDSADNVLTVLNSLAQLAVTEKAEVAVLGDLFDIRYVVPVELLVRLRDYFGNHSKVNFHLLAGNHDQINVEGRNVLEVFDNGNVNVVSNVERFDNVLWLPYRKHTSELYTELANKTTDYVFAHHGVESFPMNDHAIANELQGLKPSAFKSYRHAYFGHWHKPNTIGNITYVGSSWQVTRAETGQQKRFIIMDTETGGARSVPVEVGNRYFAMAGIAGLDQMDLRAGDEITLKAKASNLKATKAAIETLKAKGVIVRLDVEQEEIRQQRAMQATSLNEVFQAYIQDRAQPEDHAPLLEMLGEFNAI